MFINEYTLPYCMTKIKQKKISIDRFWNDLMYTQLEGGKSKLEEVCLNRGNKNTNEVMYG